MLKKAGIVVAVAAAGLLVTTPLASAQGVAAPAQVSNTCTFSQTGGTTTTTAVGGSSLFGVGGAAVNIVAPVSVPIQAANCTAVNVSDLINVNSNNTQSTTIRIRIQNSFNRFIFRP